MYQKSIIVKFDLEGGHQWSGAPEEFRPLRSFHKHIFHFEAYIPVDDPNRQIEFLKARLELRKAVIASYGAEPCDFWHMSCEMLAESLARLIKNKYGVEPTRVVVMEDVFVGAEIVKEVE